jgi:hypothetical protein
VLVLALPLLLAAPASSQFAVAFGGGGQPVAEYDVPIHAAGYVQVKFTGDTAAGCAAHGLCGYSGSDTWDPGGMGELLLIKYRQHHRSRYDAFLALGLGVNGSTTYGRVTGPGGGTCEDAQPNGAASADLPLSGDRVGVSLREAGLLGTRCAGPLDADIAGALEQRVLNVRALERGLRVINLSGTKPFTGHGFSGTVTSTLALSLGKGRRQPTSSGLPPHTRSVRVRFVTVKLGSVRLDGRLSARLRGVSDPDLCAVLDSCGSRGALRFSLPTRPGTGELSASGSAKLPYRDFLFALGLARRGSAKGITGGGYILVQPSAVSERLVQGDAECSDSSVDDFEGSVSLSQRTMELQLGPGLSDGVAPRTRCPGPMSLSAPEWTASERLGGALRGHTASFDLRPIRHSADDGWVITSAGTVTVRLRRLKISSTVFEEPAQF